MNTIMGAQENLALTRSLFDLSNNHQSDPAWLDKSRAAFAADAEVIDVPSGTTLHGPDGYKRLILFFAENLPDSRVELTKAFATQDQACNVCTQSPVVASHSRTALSHPLLARNLPSGLHATPFTIQLWPRSTLGGAWSATSQMVTSRSEPALASCALLGRQATS